MHRFLSMIGESRVSANSLLKFAYALSGFAA